MGCLVLPLTALALESDAGKTHDESVSHCILVAVETRHQLLAIEPVNERIVQRYELPGSSNRHPEPAAVGTLARK